MPLRNIAQKTTDNEFEEDESGCQDRSKNLFRLGEGEMMITDQGDSTGISVSGGLRNE